MEGCASQEQGRKQDGQMFDYLGCRFPPVALSLSLEPGQTKNQARKTGEL